MGWMWDKSKSKKAELLEKVHGELTEALGLLADERERTAELRSEVVAMREELRDFLRRQSGDAVQEGLEAILRYGPGGGERK